MTRQNRRAEGSPRLQLKPTTLITLVKTSLWKSRCQDPVATDYAARYANLLTGYLNVMISEQEASVKDTNLYERENFAITILFPVITPSFAQRRAFERWTGVTTSIQYSYIHLQRKLMTQPNQRQELSLCKCWQATPNRYWGRNVSNRITSNTSQSVSQSE